MRAYAELVRAPAALTVLGDTVAGAAAARRPLSGRRLLLPLSSAALYWSGMALNDWADRAVDAVERPERPIPSGRISPGAALATAASLSAAGLGLAAAAGGRDALAVAAPLTAAVWLYDAVFKSTAAGPYSMAACRALDILLGAGAARARSAAPAAAVVAAHTAGVTTLSRGEVHGTSPATARAAACGTAAAALAAAAGPARTPRHRAGTAAAAAAYAVFTGRAQYAAARDTSARTVREATGTGIHGTVLLQAALTARGGPLRQAAGLALTVPLIRRLGRKVSPT